MKARLYHAVRRLLNSTRPTFFRIIQMDHVRSVKFHSCKNLKDFPRYKKLLGRAAPNFHVTAHTKVCSNHFKYGQPTADDPHPSLYLKGYPGISTPTKSKPTRRKLTYSGASAAKTSKSIGKKRHSSALSGTSSTTFLQGHDECCDELTAHNGNVTSLLKTKMLPGNHPR